MEPLLFLGIWQAMVSGFIFAFQVLPTNYFLLHGICWLCINLGILKIVVLRHRLGDDEPMRPLWAESLSAAEIYFWTDRPAPLLVRSFSKHE